MTIKLFDTQAKQAFQDAVSEYEAKVMKLAEEGKPFPMDLKYPTQPEPIADSADPYYAKHKMLVSSNAPGSSCYASPTDGTMQSDVKGFDTTWSADEGAAVKPFALKK